jgi:nucleoside phosphorylase
MNLLVVAAWEPELEHFRGLARQDLDPTSSIDAVGIGLVDAALGMARCLARYAPSQVLLLGTCGAAPKSGLAIGDAIVATDVRLIDPAVVEGRAALPYAAPAVTLDGALTDALFGAGARPARVLNPLGITTDDALAGKLGALGEAEHLESYGVARACQAATVPCAIVLGIANLVGARGRDEWRANHVAASARAAEIAYEAIRTSTRGRSPA